jgi:hypothetical protein
MRYIFVILLLSFGLGIAQEPGARYLIISYDDFYDAIEPLAQWKHKKGMMTKHVKLSDVGTYADQIKNYVANAYNTWQVRPEFLLLVGAPNLLPFPTVGYVYTDNYYTNIEGDLRNEILPGRFTVHNVTEAQTVVNKILLYERTPDLADSLWPINACLIVRVDGDPYDDSIYWGDIRHAYTHMLNHEYDTIDTLSQIYGNNATDIINSVNQGRAWVLYRGQGVGNWWSPFDVNPHSTANGAMLPIVLSITCRTIGTGSTAATAEQWFLTGSPTAPRGGAGYFATTTTITNGAYLRSAVCRGFFDAVFEDHVLTFGEACEGGRNRVYEMYSNASEYQGFTTIGDPEMNIWTGIPQAIMVQHDSVLNIDAESLHVLVLMGDQPLRDAQVCVVQETNVYDYGYTNESGEIVFFFEDNSLMPGTMDITVTRRNIIPYEGEITIADTGAYIVYQGHTVIDSLGNNNGIPENGETVLLRTVIENIGNATASQVQAAISSIDTFVSIIDGIVPYGTIEPDDTSAGTNPFAITISPFCPNDRDIVFSLNISDDQNHVWYTNFSIAVENMTGVTGPDGYGYYVYDDTDTLSGHAPVYDWLEIGAGGPGTLVAEITDEDADTVTYGLPFVFPFYGTDYNNIGLCSNGFAELNISTYRFGANTSIPQSGGPRRLLAGFWDDIDPSLNGDIYYYHDESNHRWIIEYTDCAHYGNASLQETFQIILYDPAYIQTPTGDGEIVYQYAHVADASSVTVGIEDETETRGLQYVYDNNYGPNAAPLVDTRTLLITTTPPYGTYNIPWLYIYDFTVNDSVGGNNNGIIEPDETVEIVITAKNGGDTTAFNVVGTLRSIDTDVSITDSLASFGNIAAGAIIQGSGDTYSIYVTAAPEDSTLGFTLHFHDDSGYEKDDYFTLHIYGIPGVEENTQIISQHAPGISIIPNPFSQRTLISYCISSDSRFSALKMYDITGRLVMDFSGELRTSGHVETIMWNGTDRVGRHLAAGVYFLHLESDDLQFIKKTILVK